MFFVQQNPLPLIAHSFSISYNPLATLPMPPHRRGKVPPDTPATPTPRYCCLLLGSYFIRTPVAYLLEVSSLRPPAPTATPHAIRDTQDALRNIRLRQQQLTSSASEPAHPNRQLTCHSPPAKKLPPATINRPRQPQPYVRQANHLPSLSKPRLETPSKTTNPTSDYIFNKIHQFYYADEIYSIQYIHSRIVPFL